MREQTKDAGLWPSRWWWAAAVAWPFVMLAPVVVALWPE